MVDVYVRIEGDPRRYQFKVDENSSAQEIIQAGIDGGIEEFRRLDATTIYCTIDFERSSGLGSPLLRQGAEIILHPRQPGTGPKFVKQMPD